MTSELNRKLSEQLSRYIPEASIKQMVDWILMYNVQVKITPARKSKLGDYRPPNLYKGKGHRISINGNLNQYSFLVTFIHEFAHLFTFEKYKNTVKPHGTEWKEEYKKSMDLFLGRHIFPIEVENAIRSYMLDPAASTCHDDTLYNALRQYDAPTPQNPNVENIDDLLEGQHFRLQDDYRIFEKGKLMRKRYRCKELRSGRTYAVRSGVEVMRIDIDKATSNPITRENEPKPSHPDCQFVKDVAEGQKFRFPNDHRVFVKGYLRRTRFLCIEVATKKEFTVPANMEVLVLDAL